MSNPKLNNITELRNEVARVFMDLRNKVIDVHDAATLAKLADTMITSTKVELDYNRFSNNPAKIGFLDSTANMIEAKPLAKKLTNK